MGRSDRDLEREGFWRLVMEQFAVGGLSIRLFCKQEGLREPSFYHWRRELSRRDGKPLPTKPRPKTQKPLPGSASFVELVVDDRPTTTPSKMKASDGELRPDFSGIEVRTPEGWVVRVADASSLPSVLAAVRASC